ncbi:TonB-dependent receptor plug domain-containing protein [Algoriphagus sp. NG3]|uniref:TonB-dependent receptor plug domain-containing protein n=1 Tax=Algoriphagus sp. NG3 TaxID=3097546 RepID=UPI002A834667|nr:TonB-dependent receptor plug domain-containing protein [Algoriphagus sp. NG3]WPR74331.1 TonB-dependent receptor plug domain-containing protein [Algoriphagus sp. NG3]
MIKSPAYCILAALVICFHLSLTPYHNPLNRIISSFEKYLAILPQEKVYLHTDRSYYAAGETIWFKSYLTSGPYHLPSTLSYTIYVELISSEGVISHRHQIFSHEGFASGHFTLPDPLPSGNYLLRAYTNWMRNSGEEYFFHKQVKIFNTEEALLAEKQHDNNIDLQFFPEGGFLINGIMNRVGFKAVGSDGFGKFVKGKILEDEKVIAEFESNQLGMGVIGLIPEEGRHYKARLDTTGEEVILPDPSESGIAMAVTNSPNSSDILVKIQASESFSSEPVYLLAQSRGIVCATSQADLSNKVAFIKIPNKEFPSGIAQITLVDEKGFPLAERLVFIDHEDQIQVSIKPNKKSYAPRDSVHIAIEAKDKAGIPIIANFSLSVVDGSQIDMDQNGETIKSNLLITSELKGTIESPGYYFNPDNQDRHEALDLLMLTQGWRKFTTKEAWEGNIPKPEYRAEKGLTIRGKLEGKNQQAIPEGTVSYLSLYPIPESKTVATSENGSFEFHDLIFFDSTNLVLQGQPKKGKANGTVLLDNSYSSPQAPKNFTLNSPNNPLLERVFQTESELRRNSNRAFDLDDSDFILEGVEVKGKQMEPNYTGPKIYGEGTIKIQVAGNPGLENQQHVLELVRGRVAGVQVSGSGNEWKVLIQGVGSINSGTDPLIMIDDTPMDIKSLIMIPVQEIESYTVWKGADTAIFGSRGANGAIGFYTKKGIEGTNTATKETGIPKVKGYQVQKEFYSPKHTSKNIVNPKPDRRATLFWAPYVQTDSAGKASVSFYNHDIETVIYGELQGLSRNGKPGYGSFTYLIEK